MPPAGQPAPRGPKLPSRQRSCPQVTEEVSVSLSSETPPWSETWHERYAKPEREVLTWSLQQCSHTWVYVHRLEHLYLPIDSGQFVVLSRSESHELGWEKNSLQGENALPVGCYVFQSTQTLINWLYSVTPSSDKNFCGSRYLFKASNCAK